MSWRRSTARLVVREYLPLAGWIACWGIVVAVVGAADAARLLAATIYVRSIRVITELDTAAALRRQIGAAREQYARMRIIAARIETLSLVAAVPALAALVAMLSAFDEMQTGWLCLLVAVGVPARALGFVSANRRQAAVYRSALAWGGAVLAAGAWVSGLGLTGVALAVGAREWLALAASLFTRPPSPAAPGAAAAIQSWRDVAALSYALARQRLFYRVSKGVLGVVLGPFGGIAARTGREFGMHRRLERLAPQTVATVVVLFIGSLSAAIGVLVVHAAPATLIVSASLLRIAAASGSVLLWRRYEQPVRADDDVDDG